MAGPGVARARGIARGEAPTWEQLDELARRVLRMALVHGEERTQILAARAVADRFLRSPAINPNKPKEGELTEQQIRLLLAADPRIRQMARDWEEARQ